MIVNRLNNRIEFYSITSGKNDYGEAISTPKLELTLWADIAKDSIKEYQEHDFDEKGSRRLTFLIDHRASLKIKREWTIKFRDNNFEIVDIERDYTFKDMTKIMASEVSK